MKKYVFIIIPAILILIFLIIALPAPDPARCRICESIPYHAPCLIDLATGEVVELAVYDSDPNIPGELSDIQQSGVLSITSICGHMAYADKNNWVMHISISKNQNEYEEQYFCRSCRELIAPFSYTGFVLADLKEPMTPKLYPITETTYSIRCYSISISSTPDSGFEITNTGMLNR